MAGTKQDASMRARKESYCQELQVIAEHMNNEAGKAVGHCGAKAKTDERSSGGSSGRALERNQTKRFRWRKTSCLEMEELLKDRWRTKAKEWEGLG